MGILKNDNRALTIVFLTVGGLHLDWVVHLDKATQRSSQKWTLKEHFSPRL